jgi:hypothetical protein
MNIKLSKILNILEKNSLYREADNISNIIIKLCQKKEKTSPVPNQSTYTYVVKKGDTLQKIAEKIAVHGTGKHDTFNNVGPNWTAIGYNIALQNNLPFSRKIYRGPAFSGLTNDIYEPEYTKILPVGLKLQIPIKPQQKEIAYFYQDLGSSIKPADEISGMIDGMEALQSGDTTEISDAVKKLFQDFVQTKDISFMDKILEYIKQHLKPGDTGEPMKKLKELDESVDLKNIKWNNWSDVGRGAILLVHNLKNTGNKDYMKSLRLK